jgi:hypothetical protein
MGHKTLVYKQKSDLKETLNAISKLVEFNR